MSRILLIGASGFIGRHLAAALADKDHQICYGYHRTQPLNNMPAIPVDFRATDPASWAQKLTDIDIVVNCAGVVHSPDIEKIHHLGPAALFQACAKMPVKKLIHLSALGAHPQEQTLYQQSKGRAEQVLSAISPADLSWSILRPSVVIGQGGASTTLLMAIAALPCLPRFVKDQWQIQPVAIHDLTALILKLIEAPNPLPPHLDVVGPEAVTLSQLLLTLRCSLGQNSKPPFIPFPTWLLSMMGRLGPLFGQHPLNKDIIAMMQQHNRADPAPCQQYLGRPLRTIADFLCLQTPPVGDQLAARLFFIKPMLRLSLAFLWIITGLCSAGLYPVDDSLSLLADLGFQGVFAKILLFGGAGLDLCLGFLLLINYRLPLIATLQLTVILLYSLIALGLPDSYWLHPFAPLLKNIPIAVATLTLIALEVPRCKTS